MKRVIFLFLLSAFLLGCSKEPGNLKISKIFGNHMVIQREQPVKIWGMAHPGTKVSVAINDNSESTRTGKDGAWLVTLPPLQLGDPVELKVETHDTLVVITDIAIGDVWVCSGQSNMELALDRAETGMDEISAANFENIRYFDIEHDIEFSPLDTLRSNPEWQKANSSDIGFFSAVGYFFGKELHQELGIPIGLIGSNWGGTVAESWMSLDAADQLDEFDTKVNDLRTNTLSVEDANAKAEEMLENWKANQMYQGIGLEEKWYLPETDIADWKTMQVPALWEDVDPELANFDGAVWFRYEFDLPQEFLDKDLKMWFGQIDEHDQGWVNGEPVGENLFSSTWSNYEVPVEILKEKGNVLVIRIFDTGGKGGFKGNTLHFDYFPVDSKAKTLSSAGEWHYKRGSAFEGEPYDAPGNSQIGPNDYPSLLFNAMINPITNFGIKGAIWYQGEANASRAYQYQRVFPAMISDWREQWNIGDFPFYFVQLANFMERYDHPTQSDWAELREAQTMTLDLPNTGMATIIDIGEADDIHPLNKRDVGKRLALNALALTYNQDLVYSGPMYQSHIADESKIMIEMKFASGLNTSDGENVKGFTIAGEDKVFYNAETKIDNGKLIVYSSKVDNPVAVRYAWADNPATNLYNSAGLPAVPFRTDSWPGVTIDTK